jgi:AcrR family transcriptional regulator
MAEIAAPLGLTPAALYRYFAGKENLLYSIIVDGADRLCAATRGSDLREVLENLARESVAARGLGVLWKRESRHLADERQHDLRLRLRTLAELLRDAMRETEAGTPEERDIRAWAILAVMASPSHHGVQTDDDHLVRLLVDASLIISQCEITSGRNHVDPAYRTAHDSSFSSPLLPSSSRREQLLAAGIRLFSERGYESVNVGQIGAAVDMRGPSVYNHFPSKADLLVDALTRASDSLRLAFTQAVESSEDSASALQRVLESYVSLSIAHSQLMGMLITEVISLPDDARHKLRRIQHEYVADWVRLLRDITPALSEPDAWVVAHFALAIVNDLVKIRHLRETWPDLGSCLVAIGNALVVHNWSVESSAVASGTGDD